MPLDVGRVQDIDYDVRFARSQLGAGDRLVFRRFGRRKGMDPGEIDGGSLQGPHRKGPLRFSIMPPGRFATLWRRPVS